MNCLKCTSGWDHKKLVNKMPEVYVFANRHRVTTLNIYTLQKKHMCHSIVFISIQLFLSIKKYENMNLNSCIYSEFFNNVLFCLALLSWSHLLSMFWLSLSISLSRSQPNWIKIMNPITGYRTRSWQFLIC